MPAYADVQRLEPGGLVELFELNLVPLGGDVLRFHGYQHIGDITWKGVKYEPWPINVSGLGRTSDAQQTAPTLSVGNIGRESDGRPIIGVVSALCIQYQDLVGALVTIKTTLAQYLDVINFPSKERQLRIARYQGAVLPDDPAFAISRGDWSLECRVTPGEIRAGWQHFFGGPRGTIAIGVNNGELGTTLAAVADAPMSGVNLGTGGEVHVVVTWRRSDQQICYYVNGAQVKVGAFDYYEYAGPGLLTNLIGRSYAYDASFVGAIRAMRIYRKVLSPSQVLGAYQSGTVYNPMAQYDANEIDGTILTDSAGQRHGVLVDGAYFEPRSYSNPTADPSQGFEDDIWEIAQRTTEIPTQIEFRLSNPLDLDGMKFPGRQVIANVCPWIAIGGYRGPQCQYSGPPFDINGNPVTDATQDKCNGLLTTGCKVRFDSINQPLNFGGAPGADQVR